jgi:hypothetical protein
MNDQLVELGTLVNNENTAVQRVGANLIDGYFMSFNASDIEMETTALVLYYMTDIQVRDFALGILDKYDAKRTELALCHLVNKAPTDSLYISAPSALLAVLYYEQGNTADALITLSNAQENYSLARLLTRVFRSGWEPAEFVHMRKELHPQVIKNIFGEEK